MDVSIIIPIHNPDKKILEDVEKSVKNQSYEGKINVIKVNEGFGLAKSLNYGIKKAKTKIVVSLHQDCVPKGNNWLKKLIGPLKNKDVVATTSDVFDVENRKLYTPALDEKGCAYKKEALEKVRLFDDKTFLNSGEDMDMYLKLKKLGKISYPHCIVEHHHKGYLIKKSKYKKLQNANTNGCLFRIYGFRLPRWWISLILANPFNFEYSYWFWRGFINRKQDFRK